MYLHRCIDIVSGNLASHRKSRLQRHFVGHGPNHKTRSRKASINLKQEIIET